MKNDTQSQTESLLDIVKGIESKVIMLPEFQRDFRWELEQTYDLFDSLIRDIFIGTLIYGKPSFGMSLREIDTRPRKGKGSNAPLQTYSFATEEIVNKTQTENLKIVLDGQQRITSIYRAVTGIDTVYLILKSDLDDNSTKDKTLEEIFQKISGEESDSAVSIKLSDAYDYANGILDEDDDFKNRFSQTIYSKKHFYKNNEQIHLKRKVAEKLYRGSIKKLNDLYKQQKMVAYYLLDMNLDKFCIFFERSNSRGIQLNFTDILAAKLYHGFNLRKKIEDFESQNKFELNREIIVRSIAYLYGVERGGTVSIDRKTILDELDADDFNKYWDDVCNLYTESLNYLLGQNFVLSQNWMPSENMIIPLMMFRRQIKNFTQTTEKQRRFIEFWYWASIFANRYSMASNEMIIVDSNVLTQIAKGEKINILGYFNKMRSLITEPEDLFNYSKRTSAIYRGILNLLGYDAKGLMDWKNTQKINASMTLDDHHIFPRAYINSKVNLDILPNEAEQLVDCVANRTLIPKLTNIQIGKKAPQAYLAEIKQKYNPKLEDCLVSHRIDKEMVSDPDRNALFKFFLEERAKSIFALIRNYVIEPMQEIVSTHGAQVEDQNQDKSKNKLLLKDLIASGKVNVGDKVFVKKYPDQAAIIHDGQRVIFNGEIIYINQWGQKVTGWSSINIYENVVLEKTNQTLDLIRKEL